MVGIEDQQQGGILTAAQDPGGLRAAIEEHAETAGVLVVPVFLGHLLAAGRQPGDVLDTQRLVVLADQEAPLRRIG